jgi:hypothetical protein
VRRHASLQRTRRSERFALGVEGEHPCAFLHSLVDVVQGLAKSGQAWFAERWSSPLS